MRYLVTFALFLGLTLALAHARAASPLAFAVVDANVRPTARLPLERERSVFAASRIAQNTGPELRDPTAAQPDPSKSPSSTKLVDVVCQTLEFATLANDLPPGFLTRLIWQESRFDAEAISSAGAQGIAQFMPGTAAWVGLANPFDAVEAITKSAKLLRDLKQQFGNLGLAAAAYNAGPKHVADWLAGRRSLPQETLAYVLIVTGHAAQEWTTPQASQLSLNLPDGVPCPQIAKFFARLERPRTTSGDDNAKPATGSAVPTAPWGVQLIGSRSQISALASYYQLQKKYKTVLGSRQPLVIRSQAGRNASWYRVRVAAATFGEAEILCASLRAVGGSCLVQRN